MKESETDGLSFIQNAQGLPINQQQQKKKKKGRRGNVFGH